MKLGEIGDVKHETYNNFIFNIYLEVVQFMKLIFLKVVAYVGAKKIITSHVFNVGFCNL